MLCVCRLGDCLAAHGVRVLLLDLAEDVVVEPETGNVTFKPLSGRPSYFYERSLYVALATAQMTCERAVEHPKLRFIYARTMPSGVVVNEWVPPFRFEVAHCTASQPQVYTIAEFYVWCLRVGLRLVSRS